LEGKFFEVPLFGIYIQIPAHRLDSGNIRPGKLLMKEEKAVK
jgi:hypothetical protein